VINPALTGLAGTACCAVALRGWILMRSPSAAERRELRGRRGTRESRPGPTRRLVDSLGGALGPRLLGRMSISRRERVQRRLDLAGGPGGMTLSRYAEVRAAFLALGIVIGMMFLLLGSVLLALVCVVLAIVSLDWWLSSVGRRRQRQLERDAPDFIDVLAITVRAGVGYRAALERVASSLEGPPSEEIVKTLRQMELGAMRRDAFQALRARNDSKTLSAFVGAQLQAEELGVPLADALSGIAADTRQAAAQEARRRAQRMTPRVTLVAVFLLMPATMMLIVGGLIIGSGVSFSHL